MLVFLVSTELIIGDIDMSWNASYTRRKQKEMTENAISEYENQTAWSSSVGSYSTHHRRMEQKRHDRFCWRIGYCILAIVVAIFIVLIIGISQ